MALRAVIPLALTDADLAAIRERCEAAEYACMEHRGAVLDCESLFDALTAERAARRAAEADAAAARERMRVVKALAEHARDEPDCQIGGNHAQQIADEANAALATLPPGVARWQAVVEAARRVVAEAAPDAEGLRREPSRQAVDALAEALREAGVAS